MNTQQTSGAPAPLISAGSVNNGGYSSPPLPTEPSAAPQQKQAIRLPALRQQMTESQFNRMVDYAVRRLEGLRNGLADWRSEMDRARRESDRNLEDRLNNREAQIFLKSNESTDIVAGAAEFVVSRINEDVFGTEPWFMVVPERTQAPAGQEAPDVTLATEIDEHAKWKLRCIGWKTAGRDAIKTAVDLGTAILKTTWKKRVESYWRYANVLVHAANPNESVVTGAGDYIFDTDELQEQCGVPGEAEMMWQPADQMRNDMHAQAQGMGQMGGYDPEAVDAEHAALPRRTVAAKDVNVTVDLGDMSKPGTHKWERYLIEERAVRYDDPLTETVDDRNFFAPLQCNRLEDVDFCAHVYDRRLSDIRAMLPKGDPRTETILDTVRGDSVARKEPAKQSDSANDGGDEDNPRVKVAECYFDYDPMQDGNTCRVYLVVLPSTVTGIDMGCDYLANVTPDGEYPFSAVAIIKKKNQWNGTGFYEAYRRIGTAIDRNFNAMIYRNDMHANPVIGTHEDVLEEELEDLQIGPGTTVTLKQNMHMKDFIEAFTLPDLDERTYEIIKMMINLFQIRSGVSSAAQGDVSELPQVNTATGINSVLASGSTLHNELLEQIRGEIGQGGLIDHLDKTIRLLYTRQNREETFAFGHGQFRKIVTITPEQVRNLKMHVHLLLTRFKQKQDADNAQAALQVLMNYIQIPEQEKPAARTLCVQLVKARGFDNADTIIREPLAPQPAMPGAVGPDGQPVPALQNGTYGTDGTNGGGVAALPQLGNQAAA